MRMWHIVFALSVSLTTVSVMAADGKNHKLPAGAVPAEELVPIPGSSLGDAIAKGHVIKDGKSDKAIRVGLWTTAIGTVKIEEREYNLNGELDGETRTFYANGQLMMKESYRSGVRTGVSEWYSPEGVLMARSMFKEGKLNGESCEYDEQGNLTKRVMYKNGNLESQP